MAPDQYDGTQLCGLQGKSVVAVLEQNNTFLGEALRQRVTSLHVRHLLRHWMIEEAGGKDCTQDAMHMIVDLVLGDFPPLDRLLQRVAKE